MAKINKRGKKITINIDDIGKASLLLRAVGFTNIPDLLDRAAEHRNEAETGQGTASKHSASDGDFCDCRVWRPWPVNDTSLHGIDTCFTCRKNRRK